MAGVLNYLFLDSFELNLDFHSFHLYAAWHFSRQKSIDTGLEFCTVVLYND